VNRPGACGKLSGVNGEPPLFHGEVAHVNAFDRPVILAPDALRRPEALQFRVEV